SQTNGLNNYGWEINNATATLLPPDPFTVSGWSVLRAVSQTTPFPLGPGNFNFTATPSDKLTFALQTLLNPTPVGTHNFGPMANFAPDRSYSWPVIYWDYAYPGPTGDATLTASTNFLTTGNQDYAPFANPIHGTFGWHLDLFNHNLNLVYTPVPEPGALALA